MEANDYLQSIIEIYTPRPLDTFKFNSLITILSNRWWDCLIEIKQSWSMAKWTAISLSSDLDLMVSLVHNCNETSWWLESIFNSLWSCLNTSYWINNVRKQNVSYRINLNWIKIDITPARKLSWNTNEHTIRISKQNTWQKTNIQMHINDISNSWRINEIKLLKIRRELNNLEFTSIYLEYLVLNILSWKSKQLEHLSDNFLFILTEIANTNVMFKRIIDPANSNNILSDLLTQTEKESIIRAARLARQQQYWNNIVY